MITNTIKSCHILSMQLFVINSNENSTILHFFIQKNAYRQYLIIISRKCSLNQQVTSTEQTNTMTRTSVFVIIIISITTSITSITIIIIILVECSVFHYNLDKLVAE